MSAAMDWINRAIEAGHDPVVIVQPDGRQSIYQTQIHINREVSPGRLPDEIFIEVLDRLVEMGRVCRVGGVAAGTIAVPASVLDLSAREGR